VSRRKLGRGTRGSCGAGKGLEGGAFLRRDKRRRGQQVITVYCFTAASILIKVQWVVLCAQDRMVGVLGQDRRFAFQRPEGMALIPTPPCLVLRLGGVRCWVFKVFQHLDSFQHFVQVLVWIKGGGSRVQETKLKQTDQRVPCRIP
jgi:hypothetical protein